MQGSLARCSLLLLATVLGCGDRGSDEFWETTVTDSMGVRLVTHSASSLRDASVELRELLRIGVADGPRELTFGAIAGGLILPDGTLVLADRSTSEIRRFSQEGRFLGSHGRSGPGPGEYQYIREMGRCRQEGFAVFDLDYTMNLYDSSGAFLEVNPVMLDDLMSPYHLACAMDGRLAAVNWDVGVRAAIGFHTAMARLRILNPDGTERSVLGERIGSERYGTGYGSGPHPVGRATVTGFQGPDLVVADGSIFGFERWNEEGELVEIVRIERPLPNADSLMAEYREISLGRATTDEQRRRISEELDVMGVPERASHISALFVTADRVLVRELSVTDGGRWFELTDEGEPVGWWPLSADALLLDVQGDQVLVGERDEMGVPHAVLYQLLRP